MSSRFDWETEEEPPWREQRQGGKQRRPLRRFLLVTILIIANVARGPLLLLRQVEQGADEVLAAIAEEILASRRVIVHEYPQCNFAAWTNK